MHEGIADYVIWNHVNNGDEGEKMSPDTVKTLKVTFSQSLPLGTRGTFTYDKELWIAYPRLKHQRIHATVDRLIGLHDGITREMLRWINERPEDARFIVRVLDWTKRAREIHAEIAIEKTEARVM
jgi:hypothetical protein